MLEYIKGMDVSSMDEIEQLGAVFYDEGRQGDLLEILKKYGSNYVRLRLWNDPKSEDGKPYGAGNTDHEVTIRMAKRVKAAGMKFLLDFHYSDFWADPGKQRKVTVCRQMAVFAVDRHIIFRLQQHLKQLYLLGAGVSGGMNAEEYRIRNDLDAGS